MKTKLLALLLMLAMIVGALASCGSGGEGEGEGEGTGTNGPEKITFAKWEKAVDLSIATISCTVGDTTTLYWATEDGCFTESEDGAFVEANDGYLTEITNLLKSRAFYDAASIKEKGKYTVASYTIAGVAATNIQIVLAGDYIATLTYKANGVTTVLTATKVNDTEKPRHDRTKTYYWTDNRTIHIEMNLDSSNGELTDLTRRYMAGISREGEVFSTTLDQLVRGRNNAAYAATNTTVSYTFVEEGKYTWNYYHGPISKAIATPTEDTPDVYCGLAWDLGACAAKGDFVNLKSTTRGQGKNYFTFNEDNYNADFDDEGYFYELMCSMSPVDDKMYLYASNYTLDAIRAIYCIPVSITLLESLDLTKIAQMDTDVEYEWDSDKNGDFDVDDFYDIVLTNNWTYDVLGILGGAAYENTSGAASANFGDTLGFVYDVNTGLQCAGIMFSNDLKLFERTYDTKGNPLFIVSEYNDGFVELVSELSEVFNYSGNFADNAAPAGYDSIMFATRDKFSEDKILFGGIVTIGALDYEEYQSMVGGFGIVPIPLISKGREYVSAIHNIARVMGIAKCTDSFEAVSAFLDYQALNSDKTMTTYYTLLEYDTVGGDQYNIRVLGILRNSLGDNSTHYLENQIQTRPNGITITIDRWSRMLRTKNLDPEALRIKYEESVGNKNSALAELVAVYQGFEN